MHKQNEGRMPGAEAIHDGLAVYRFGRGESVLLMPGPHRFQKPGDRSADALIEGLTNLGRQVITFDPPGSGRSFRPARVDMAEMIECAGEALDLCGASNPVDAMGHSMGGLVTLAYALEQPARVRRLVLVGTGSGGPSYMKAPGALWNRSHPAFWRTALLGIFYTLWPRRATERIFASFVERYSYYDQSHCKGNEIHLRDWWRPPQGKGTEWHRVARKLDYAPRLAEIDAPTLLLCGCHDPQYPPSCSEELAAGIKRSRLITFRHSGHYPFIEEAEAFWREVGTFLNGGVTGRLAVQRGGA